MQQSRPIYKVLFLSIKGGWHRNLVAPLTISVLNKSEPQTTFFTIFVSVLCTLLLFMFIYKFFEALPLTHKVFGYKNILV